MLRVLILLITLQAMDLQVFVLTFCTFVLRVSTKLTTGNWTIYSNELISVSGATIQFSCPVNCTKLLPVWSLHGYVLSDGLKINPTVIQRARLNVKQNCSEQTNNLVIFNITKSDKGTYCCEERQIRHCTVLELTELIIEKDENSTIHGVEGETFSLSCFFTKAIRGVHLKVVNNHSIVESSTSHRLNVTLKATKELHHKQFTCAAVFDDMEISLERNVTLNITYKPKITIKVLPFSYLTVGDNATFICSSDSNPNPISIFWKKDGRVVSIKDTFVMTNIARAATGQYQCIVDNGKFVGEGSIQIFVSYKLVVNIIASPGKKVAEGNKLTMACTHDSNLHASITWIRHGVSVSTNQVLVLHEVSMNDSGLYQCIVNTTIGYGADAISILVLYDNKEDENGDISVSENVRKEMVYYMVATSVIVLLLLITWKAFKHCKSRGLAIEITNDIGRMENTNHETNESIQMIDESNMQHEDDRSSNYERINENEMLPLSGLSNLVVVEGDVKDDISENRDGESEIYSTSLSSDSEPISDTATERNGHEVFETTNDGGSSDNFELTSPMANECRNPYIPLIRNEMEYLNSYSALRRLHN